MPEDMMDAAGRFLAAANRDPDRSVERVLCRNVTDTLFAVQVWYFGDREPESTFVEFGQLAEELRPKSGAAKPRPERETK